MAFRMASTGCLQGLYEGAHLLPVTFLAAAPPGARRLSGALPVPAVSSDSPDRGGSVPWYADVPPDVVPLEARTAADATPSPVQCHRLRSSWD